MSISRMRRPVRARSRKLVFPALVLAILALSALILGGCGKDEAPGQGADQHQAGGQKSQGGQKQGGQNQAGQKPAQSGHGGPGGRSGGQAIPVAVTASVTGDISSYYRATATLEAEKEAQILARVTGVIEAIVAEEGDLVKAGDPLLKVDNDEYRFRLEQAEAATINLKSRFDRLTQMREQELATEEEYQAARSEYAAAEADEGLARLNLSYTTVTAPFDGAVTQRLIEVGQNLGTGDAVFVMADFNPLLARVHVPSREFKKLRQDQTVELVLDSDGERLFGRIKLISPVIDPTSGTIKLTVEVPDYPAGTRPGDFAQVQIVTEKREGVVLVPRGAVVTDKAEKIVFTVVDGEDGEPVTAERRVVEVGFTDDENAEILTGLAAGEKVVTKGQRSLKHGTALKVIEDVGAGS
jgi:membrane fusion protein (multidrug efflux system)